MLGEPVELVLLAIVGYAFSVLFITILVTLLSILLVLLLLLLFEFKLVS